MSTNVIEISNLKGIDKLTFTLPSVPGAYLLVGENGCGKTTLLTCLDRIGNSQAFREGFPPAIANDIDSYHGASVTYFHDGKSLTYTKANKRWAPKPKDKTQEFLRSFGFEETIYARADSDRLQNSQDDIKSGNMVDASEELKSHLREVFDDCRFDNLKLLENKNGRRWFNYYYVLEKDQGGYFSEKMFSTGELAVLRLLGKLMDAKDNCLVLLDEAELALHPKVQVKLYGLLVRISTEKRLTTIVSTHSTTLVKSCDRDHIILIEKGKVVTPCYPARALESIDEYREVTADYSLLFEDEMAEDCFRAMYRYLKTTGSLCSTASFSTTPVGGFKQTVKMAVNLRDKLPKHTTVKAVLDHDFMEARNGRPFVVLCEENRDSINDLGFTPEVQLIETITSHAAALEKTCRHEFGTSIHDVLSSEAYKELDSANPRVKAKRQFDFIVDQLRRGTHNRDVVKYKLIDMVVAFFDKAIMKETVGIVLSSCGLGNDDIQTLRANARQ